MLEGKILKRRVVDQFRFKTPIFGWGAGLRALATATHRSLLVSPHLRSLHLDPNHRLQRCRVRLPASVALGQPAVQHGRHSGYAAPIAAAPSFSLVWPQFSTSLAVACQGLKEQVGSLPLPLSDGTPWHLSDCRRARKTRRTSMLAAMLS